jgi:hypothetical protein
METKSKRTPSRDDLFTGGKTPEYAVFYNIAFFKIAGFINFLINKTFEDDKMKLEGIINDIIKKPEMLIDSHYLKLRNYLWKGYRADKNDSVTKLMKEDKENIIGMVDMLRNIRNFHSHIWHDNKALIFKKELKTFIEQLHDEAKLKQSGKYSKELEDYEESLKEHKLFKPHENDWYISPEGRNFFLGFFLTNGEMNHFMKQRKGCKRDDKPEFKIKHVVYTYYTHREAATHNHYGFEETTLAEMPADYVKDIMNERQAYKIINYLNDVPEEIIDIKLFPLFLKDKTLVTIADEFIQLIREHNLLNKLTFSLIHNKEEQEYERIIQASYNNFNFKLKCSSLHKIILNIIRDNEEEKNIYKSLDKFIKERNILITMVEKGLDKYKIPDEPDAIDYTLEEFYTSKLRANDKTNKLFGKWLDSKERLGTSETSDREKLINELKNNEIELTFYDFYYERDEKPRPEKFFMEYAIQYLLDMNIVPDWEWQVEKLNDDNIETSKNDNIQTGGDKEFAKTKSEFLKTIPKGYKLVFRDDQLLVRYNKMYFQLGHRVMKNLLIAHFNGKEIKGFFDLMMKDILKIKDCAVSSKQINYSDLEILDTTTLPRYMKQIIGDSSVKLDNLQLMALVGKRIIYILNELKSKKDGEIRLSRAEKNRQIMRCYKYFDWKYKNDDKFKFLRKNEYQQLSIYHYCLDKEPRESKKLYKTLIGDIEKHMPDEIIQLLKTSESFDDLFLKVIDRTIDLLNKWNNRLHSMNLETQKIRYAKLGFSTMLTADNINGATVNKNLIGKLPFEVHPILVLKNYYSKKLKENNGNYSISTQVRDNPIFVKGLKEINYNYQNYIKLFSEPKQDRKIIGEINTLKTEDALLWSVAKEYIKKVDKKVEKFDINNLVVKNYRNTVFPIELKEIDGKKVFIIVPFHQLNDFMFVESRPVLQNITAQLLLRCKNDEKLRTTILKVNDEKIEIPYIELITEMKKVFHHSLKWAEILFNWEAEIIKNIAVTEKDKKVLTQKDGFPRFGFKEVCKMAGLAGDITEVLKKLRNNALHAAIPEYWTYEEMQKDEKLKKLLGFTDEMFEKKNYFN